MSAGQRVSAAATAAGDTSLTGQPDASGGTANGQHVPDSDSQCAAAATAARAVTEDGVTEERALTEDGATAARAVAEDGVTAARAVTEDGVTAARAVTEDGMTAARTVSEDGAVGTSESERKTNGFAPAPPLATGV